MTGALMLCFALCVDFLHISCFRLFPETDQYHCPCTPSFLPLGNSVLNSCQCPPLPMQSLPMPLLVSELILPWKVLVCICISIKLLGQILESYSIALSTRCLSKVLLCRHWLQEGERQSHLSAFTLNPFTFVQSCHEQLGPSCNSLDNTVLLVTKQGSHFPYCLVTSSKVKQKTDSLLPLPESALVLFRLLFARRKVTKKEKVQK